LLDQLGCEARKFPAAGEVFSLDFYLYRTYRELTYLEAAHWFKLKVCVAEENRIAPARRRQLRPGFGLTCFATFAAEINFLEPSMWLTGIFCAKS
jgi:hypothetical protein